MAKKKNEMVKTDKGQLPAELLAEYAEDAADNLANVKDAYFRVSIKGSRFKVDDNKIGVDGKGEEFSAVILREVPVNSYNEEAYDPKAPAQQPTCWSLGGFKPVPGCDTPQAESCAVCDFNKFGSAIDMKTGDPGKGKRCANNRRLILKVQGYDMPVLMSIPPTSRKNFDSFLKQISAGEQKVPMFAMVTTFTFDDGADWPVIEFSLGKFLSPEEYRACREFRMSDPVEDAINAYATLIDLEDGDKEEEGF
jgi:hypothetical protein